MKLRTRRPALLAEVDLRKIYEAGIRVARQVPLRCEGTDEFFAYLRGFGCDIDGDLVRLTPTVVDKVVAAMEAHRVTNLEKGLATEDELPTELTCNASGQGLYCCDLDTDLLRPATIEDLTHLSRVVDAVDGLNRSAPGLIPTDVPKDTADLHAFATGILNSSKPHRTHVYNEDNIERFFEIEVIARGGDEAVVRKNPSFSAKLWINSPFMISGECVRMAMKMRTLYGVPLEIDAMPMVGASTPATFAGALVLGMAETVLSNAISLAVDETTCGFRVIAGVSDMRSGGFAQNGPDADVVQLASAEMAEHCFGRRTSVPAGSPTTAKVPGAQSMMEKSIATLFRILCGGRVFGGLGSLACADAGSLVQLMLDVEMMQYFQHLLRGMEVDEEHLAEEVIRTVVPTGARFLEHEHTLRHCREELFSPELRDRRVAGAWINDPVTMVDRARAKARRLVENAPNCCPLADADKKAIRAILGAADRKTNKK